MQSDVFNVFIDSKQDCIDPVKHVQGGGGESILYAAGRLRFTGNVTGCSDITKGSDTPPRLAAKLVLSSLLYICTLFIYTCKHVEVQTEKRFYLNTMCQVSSFLSSFAQNFFFFF